MKTLIIIAVVLGLTLFVYGIGFVVNHYINDKTENKLFQGPVPEGYDEQHFRLTGETKPLEEK